MNKKGTKEMADESGRDFEINVVRERVKKSHFSANVCSHYSMFRNWCGTSRKKWGWSNFNLETLYIFFKAKKSLYPYGFHAEFLTCYDIWRL